MNIKDVFNTHYLAEKIEKYVRIIRYTLNINLVYEQKLLGTGRTLKANRHFFKNEAILLVHADNLSFLIQKNSYKNLIIEKKIVITMMTFETESPENCGVIELSKDGEIKNFYEKVKNPQQKLLTEQFI